ncbi:nitroreductase family protein [Desulfobotulus mexicanus]|uniref:Nitroreductase family protein n=1 Tax=Desulfobotulus mexicanus TaxID=2586642 RepID=A0A5Q4VDA9_9BACT|nr:nitroreductase family protein [Desulfobotulus mexicanus]TYT74916.1 nitroreductase family protein [Desulfobotulus mexicanus]
MFRTLVEKSRSIRRFAEEEAITAATLEGLVELVRFTPSAGNLQALGYRLVVDVAEKEAVFSALGWAAYLKDWPGPAAGQRPAAYIVICGPVKGSAFLLCDLGIAAQTMALGAAEKGLGTCMLGSMDKKALRRVLHIPEELEVLLVLALGKPAETVVVDTMEEGDSVHYWRDETDVHHVPKRPLAKLLLP